LDKSDIQWCDIHPVC